MNRMSSKLQSIRPHDLTEDIADFSFLYDFSQYCSLSYYSPPKSAWTHLEVDIDGVKYFRFVGRDEIRPDILMQVKSNKNRFLVCEGKTNINEFINSDNDGFFGEINRMSKFLSFNLNNAKYELVDKGGAFSIWDKELPFTISENIFINACYCFNMCHATNWTMKEEMVKLHDNIERMEYKNIFGVIYYWDYINYQTVKIKYIKTSTDEFWRNLIEQSI